MELSAIPHKVRPNGPFLPAEPLVGTALRRKRGTHRSVLRAGPNVATDAKRIRATEMRGSPSSVVHVDTGYLSVAH